MIPCWLAVWNWWERRKHAKELYAHEEFNLAVIRDRFMNITELTWQDVFTARQIVHNKLRLKRYINGHSPWKDRDDDDEI